jgi:hypothetical protein
LTTIRRAQTRPPPNPNMRGQRQARKSAPGETCSTNPLALDCLRHHHLGRSVLRPSSPRNLIGTGRPVVRALRNSNHFCLRVSDHEPSALPRAVRENRRRSPGGGGGCHRLATNATPIFRICGRTQGRRRLR